MLALIDKGTPEQSHSAFWAPFVVVVGEGAVGRSEKAADLLLAMFAGEFVAAGLLKRWQVVADDMPKHVVGDAVILVAQDIADAGHFRPGDLRVPRP